MEENFSEFVCFLLRKVFKTLLSNPIISKVEYLCLDNEQFGETASVRIRCVNLSLINVRPKPIFSVDVTKVGQLLLLLLIY